MISNIVPDEGLTDRQKKFIITCGINNMSRLLTFIKDVWVYPDYYSYVYKIEKGVPFIILTLRTGGDSYNEEIVSVLLKNMYFQIWYESWKRGGEHIFYISPNQLGFRLVSEYCKSNNISRQAVHKNKKDYHFLSFSKNINFIKKIT